MTITDDEPDNPDESRFLCAFARTLTRIRAVQESDYLPMKFDIPTWVATVTRAWPKIRTFRQQFVRELPNFPIAEFDNLETYALALAYSDTLYERAKEPPASLVAFANRANDTRKTLLSAMHSVILPKKIARRSDHELMGIHGWVTVAFDLFALANILVIDWATIGTRVGIKRGQVNQVEILADELIAAIGAHQCYSAIDGEILRDRQAAYTLFINAYKQVRAGIVRLRRRQGDADSIAPPLYTRRTTRKKQPRGHKRTMHSASTSVVKPAQRGLPKFNTPLTLAGRFDTTKGSPFRA